MSCFAHRNKASTSNKTARKLLYGSSTCQVTEASRTQHKMSKTKLIKKQTIQCLKYVL